MAYTAEEQNWVRRDFSEFEKLPRRVQEAIRSHSRKIDVHELRRAAKTERDMLRLIESGEAPI